MVKNKIPNFVIVIITLFILITTTIILVLIFNNDSVICLHKNTEVVVEIAPTSFNVGKGIKKCKKCDYQETIKLNAKVNLPQLYLDGLMNGISKYSDCIVSAKFYSNDLSFEKYASIKYQGHTTMVFEKKNYTIKFYENESLNGKFRFSINNWDTSYKYVLKANYVDYGGARNLVSASLWTKVVNSRNNIDENIQKLKFLGSVSGFPTALFINDVYQGIYTFNIPKDEDTYKIADEENEAMFVINSGNSLAANFHGLITESDKKNIFDLEYSYQDNQEWPYESMNNLIDFVISSNDDLFKKDIGTYLDIEAAIDYLIFNYVMGLTSNSAKNMIFITYNGIRWIPSMYDMDTACGLIFDGSSYLPYDFNLPELKDGKIVSNTGNLLWDRIIDVYKEEVVNRYLFLRNDILSNGNIINAFKDYLQAIPNECYEYEFILYPETPYQGINQLEQISNFITNRCNKLDLIMNNFK